MLLAQFSLCQSGPVFDLLFLNIILKCLLQLFYLPQLRIPQLLIILVPPRSIYFVMNTESTPYEID